MPEPSRALDRRSNHGRIDADSSDRQAQIGKIERREQLFLPKRVARLGAQPAHTARCIIAGEGS